MLAGGLEARGAIAGVAGLANTELSTREAATTYDTTGVIEVGGVDLGLLAGGDVAVRVRPPWATGAGSCHNRMNDTGRTKPQTWQR